MNLQKLKTKAIDAVKSEVLQFGSHILERAKQAARERIYDRMNDLVGPDDRVGKRSTLRTFVTFAAGISVGAGLALVLAPMSGRQTRSVIAAFGKKLLSSEPSASDDASPGSPLAKAKAESEQIAATPSSSGRGAPGRKGNAEQDGAKETPRA